MKLTSYNDRVDRFVESPTRKIDALKEELASRGRDIILLSTGQPSIPPPKWAREELAKLLLEDSMKLYAYTPTDGRRSVKETILEDLRTYGVELEPGQLALSAGGQSALFATVLTLFKPGDKVLVFDPMYFGYWPLLDYVDARVIAIREDLGDGFQPPVDAVAEILSRERVKALILVSPDNPTGRVIDAGRARALAELAVDHGVWLIVDEAYRTLTYDREHVYIYNYAPENTISLNTFSKDPGIPGWRLGYVYGPREVVKRVKLVVQETVYCPPSIAQFLVEIYLKRRSDMQRHLEYVRSVYKEKRDALVEAVEEHLPHAEYHVPEGGMFLFLDLAHYIAGKGVSSEDLSRKLLAEEGVATVPGEYFSRHYKHALRLSFVTESPERLREGVRRIARVIDRL